MRPPQESFCLYKNMKLPQMADVMEGVAIKGFSAHVPCPVWS